MPSHPHTDEPPRRWVRALLLAAMVIVVAHLGDETAWRALRDPRVNDRDWGRLLRSAGYLPTWAFLALAVWLHERPGAAAKWRALSLLLLPAFGGAAAELLKLLVRRLRPDAELFGYTFRAFTETPLSTRGLGMPSSHVMVAFAGAGALAALFPRSRFVGYTLATGCAVTRVLSGQHFLSDVATAAALGWLLSAWLSPRLLGRGVSPRTHGNASLPSHS